MSVEVSYSHAAPYIAHQAAHAANTWKNARLVRDRTEARGKLYGFTTALDILLSSPEGKGAVVGIADRESLPMGAEDALREFIGADADKLLGPKEQAV